MVDAVAQPRLLDPDVLDDHLYLQDWDEQPAPSDDPRLARVRQAYEDGEHLPTVARELGTTKNALVGIAARAGLVHARRRRET